MGYNTVVMICNDAWGEAVRDPKGFVDAISHNMNMVMSGKPIDFGLGNHANGFEVVSCQHADVTPIIAAGGNYASILGYVGCIGHHEADNQLLILRRLAEDRGYKLVKKPARKPRVKKPTIE